MGQAKRGDKADSATYLLRGIPRDTLRRVKLVAMARGKTIRDLMLEHLETVARSAPEAAKRLARPD